MKQMNTIKRDVYVLKNTIKIPIEVTKGTDAITFEFTVRDYNLPATAAAVAYAYRMGMKKPNSTLCDVSGNVISFQPSVNFFEVGNNELQIRVINEDKSLISFKEKVKCSDSMGFPDEEEEENQSLIEQIIAQSGKESGERKAADEKERSERKTADETEKSERIAADAKEKSERQKEIATERARIDQLTKMGEGSTTGDAELADIRAGNEGATYSNAGNAVRAQTKDVPVMMDNLQSPYVDISLLEQGSINSAVGSEIASRKVLRSVEFHWNKNGKITAPAGYKIAIANYAMQPEESGQMTKVYMSFENYSDSQTSSKADGDAESRRLLIKRSDGADINAEDLRGKITTNVPGLRAMDVIENLEKKIKTDTTLEKEGVAADAAETGKRISQVEGDIGSLNEEKINKEFLYEIDGPNEQLSSTKIMDVSGNGEIAKVVADSAYRDNLIPIPDIKENTVNGLTYSTVDGIVSVSGTASTFTLIDLGVNLAMMNGINNISYKIFVFDGAMPSGVSIVLGIAVNGYTKTITSTEQEKASTGLVTFNGKNIGVSVNNGTAVDFKFGVTVVPVNTIPSKFLKGRKYIGESLDELICVSNMWAFGNNVSKIFLNTVYRFKKNNLYGKSLFVAGDSVAYGYGSNNISFGEIIAKNNNMRLTKVAISGTTFAKRDGLTNSILEQVKSIDKEYDYIIVEGGFNDYFQRDGVSIGTMPKNMNSGRDEKTTYGALDSICLWIKQNYPASKILFVVPHKIMTTTGVIDSEFYPYLQAIRDVCEKYSIQYADIALKGGCTPFYQSFRDKYFSGDGIHPNLDGYKTFYVPVIESEMEML